MASQAPARRTQAANVAPFFKLSLEVRSKIYEHVLGSATPITITHTYRRRSFTIHFLDCGTPLAEKVGCVSCTGLVGYKGEFDEGTLSFLNTSILKVSRTVRAEAIPILLQSNCVHFNSPADLEKFVKSPLFTAHVSHIRRLSMKLETGSNIFTSKQANTMLDLVDMIPAVEEVAIHGKIAISRASNPRYLIYGLFFRLHLLSKLPLKKAQIWITVAPRDWHKTPEAALEPKLRVLERDALTILLRKDVKMQMIESREAKARINEIEREMAKGGFVRATYRPILRKPTKQAQDSSSDDSDSSDSTDSDGTDSDSTDSDSTDSTDSDSTDATDDSFMTAKTRLSPEESRSFSSSTGEAKQATSSTRIAIMLSRRLVAGAKHGQSTTKPPVLR